MVDTKQSNPPPEDEPAAASPGPRQDRASTASGTKRSDRPGAGRSRATEPTEYDLAGDARATDDGKPPAPRKDTWSPAGTVNQYELIRQLGAGGMGVVWLARDTRLGRRVAIKFLKAPDPSMNTRFLVEARATASLQHENIVVIHEIGNFEDGLFMVLEYLEGQALWDLVDRRVHPLRAVELMIPIVRALQVAHAAGIVHRDLKPENVFVTSSGTVKVLDFGLAKLMTDPQLDARTARPGVDAVRQVYETMTEGSIVGTAPYMSPEQWGIAAVDHRTDLYAAGVMLFEMVTGEHPVADQSVDGLMSSALQMREPLPAVTDVSPDVPDSIAAVIDRCLQKDPDDRYASAEALLAELETLAPRQLGRAFVEGDSPYPGLLAFQEGDAGRFFGRRRDVARGLAMIESDPLLAVVGPSGVGKSSYVRAGLLPALKASGQPWQSLVLRPGRKPIESLAKMLLPLTNTEDGAEDDAPLDEQLRRAPGTLGATLRARARKTQTPFVLFVDQFEELYTLVPDREERAAFIRCLLGAADDASSPLRVIVSMRSDLLDRAADDEPFMRELSRGLLFLSPLSPGGLREALTRPAELAGYQFESPALVEQMTSALDDAPGALPLLQFAAARLWDRRDRQQRTLTQAAHDAMGGVEGTLATHADQVLQGLAAPMLRTTRAIFQRLVTPERTRAIVDMAELLQLGSDAAENERLLHMLADARLLVLHTGDGDAGGLVEIVHESLITSWPALRRWLDEMQEDAAFLAQLRQAAAQWDARERSKGLLWRGDAADDALRFHHRARLGQTQTEITAREQSYLDAVVALATRATRIRRGATVGALIFLSALVAAAAVALVTIRAAEQTAVHNAQVADTEAQRARTAEGQVKDQLAVIQDEQRARQKAEVEALEAIRAADLSREELEAAFAKLRVQWQIIRRKEQARARAQRAVAGAHQKAAETAARAEAQAAAAAAAVTEAQAEAEAANQAAAMSRGELEKALATAQTSLSQAQRARTQAEAERTKALQAEKRADRAAAEARKSEANIERLLESERTRAKKLEKAKSKIATELR